LDTHFHYHFDRYVEKIANKKTVDACFDLFEPTPFKATIGFSKGFSYF
jgi:hypothetical protein